MITDWDKKTDIFKVMDLLKKEDTIEIIKKVRVKTNVIKKKKPPVPIDDLFLMCFTQDDCLVFPFTNEHGYASYKSQPLSRLVYKYCFGDIPAKLCVCHTCDNPACIKPDHLKLGTYRDNYNDMMIKNRQNMKGVVEPWWYSGNICPYNMK